MGRCAVLMIALLVLLFTRPSSPGEIYVGSRHVGAVGDWYEEFRHGKAAWVCLEDKSYIHREPEGQYDRTKEGWILTSGKKRPEIKVVRIRCSWLGLSISSETDENEFPRCRLLWGHRLDWTLNHLPWWVQRLYSVSP